LTFHRDVHTPIGIEILGQALDHPSNWVFWHHFAKEVIVSDPSLKAGTEIEFKIENPEKQWKRFQLWASVIDYQPGKLIHLRFLRDSTGRISKLFFPLEWQVELKPEGSGTLILGTLVARTANARARFFSGIAERVLLNQVFYPDLLKLAEFKPPSDPKKALLQAGRSAF